MAQQVSFHCVEARAKVGKRIRSRVSFSGVPEGTEGTVLRAESTNGHYNVAIEWSLPGRTKPLVDWFSKEEYERLLVEIV